MPRYSLFLMTALVTLSVVVGLGSTVHAQVGKGAIVDLNTAAEKDLLALPP